jgi:hypothetical protein
VIDQVVPIEIPPCPEGPSAAQLSVDPQAGRSGDKLTISITNTGSSCLAGGLSYGWERQLPDGSWERVVPDPPGFPVPAIGISVAPGRTFTQSALVWPELDPGPHRLTKTMSGRGEELTFSAPFEVLP